VASGSLLSGQILSRCRERAPEYDRDNRFFQDDFEELKHAGYLRMAIPREFGGFGLNLAQAGRETRTLAEYAPATALALNMHNYWVGDAADAWRSGDKSVEWILHEAAAGEVFAAGHAEHGNDIPGLLSTTRAERVSGGYTFTGRKSFGSLTPVWTRLGMHGMDTSDPAAPKIVHAFMPRDTPGFTIKDTWDVLGSMKHKVVEAAFRIADGAWISQADSGCSRRASWNGCSATRAPASFHPANPMPTHELVGKFSLGINPDEQPRWG
jgi:alkylation response protein AidB-like acyl-CoA dehydrogenase